jgi:hypothetical protein
MDRLLKDGRRRYLELIDLNGDLGPYFIGSLIGLIWRLDVLELTR